MRERIQEAAILLTRHVGRRGDLRAAISDSLAGHPQAQSYDGDGGSSSPWCWKHGRPVHVCHNDDLACSGESVSSNDPTGNAAVSGDKAAAHLDELDRLERRIIDDVYRAAHILDLYLPAKLPTGAERAKLASDGDAGCHWCWTQAKTWSPPMTKDPSTVAGNLKVAVLNCRGHYDFIRTVGRAPAPSETLAWVKKGRWPKQKAA